MNKIGIPILIIICILTLSKCSNDTSSWKWPMPAGGLPPQMDQVGPRISLVEADAFHFTVYADGENVLLRNCRMARGLSGYIYWDSPTMATYEGCTDIVSGEPII